MLKNISLLVVEDDELTQEHMKILLEDEVKELYQAYDAETGMEIYLKKKPDIIITDITLPKMNGLDMAEKIKKINNSVKIIVVSAYDDKKFFLKAINEIGVDYYLLKPLDIDLLMDKLYKVSDDIKRGIPDIAYLDTLTDIYNRRYFNEKLNELINEKKDFTLLFIDLDDFKSVNDRFGHMIGDEVMKIFVSKIKNVIKKTDFLARIGGDEFAVILENADKATSKKVAEKILTTMGIIIIDGYKLKLSCSIGIKRYDNENYKEFFKMVDDALYEVKKNGKKGYYFYEKNQS